MRPVDKFDPTGDEIIAHIKDSLSSYEEDYAPGAWEKFNSTASKQTPMVLWLGRLSSAAAVIIIGSVLFWFTQTSPEKRIGTNPRSVKKIEHILPDNPAKTFEKVLPVSTEKESFHYYASTSTIDQSDVQDKLYTESSEEVSAQILSADHLPVPKVVPTTEQVTVKEPVVPHKTLTFEEFLRSETKRVASTSAETKVVKDDKWAVGVVISPSFGNSAKLNMGYGISMGYAINNKISLNSGFSYNEMAAAKSVSQTTVSSALAGENKNLESIEQQVTGIDIPLDVKYNLSDKFYANIGVSAFAVLNQQRENRYIQERLMESPSAGYASGVDIKTVVISERVKEEAPAEEVAGSNYIGFYNFSFGYKQKIAKDRSISIEPFMKVPMREVTRDNLRLMGTGLKLKFDF